MRKLFVIEKLELWLEYSMDILHPYPYWRFVQMQSLKWSDLRKTELNNVKYKLGSKSEKIRFVCSNVYVAYLI